MKAFSSFLLFVTMDVEENSQTSRKSLSLVNSISNDVKEYSDSQQNVAVLEDYNFTKDTSSFTTSVLFSQFQRDKKTQCDTSEVDEPPAIKSNIKLRPKLNSLKSFESDDTVDTNSTSGGFNVEKQLALETKRSNPNSRTISKMKNIAFVLAGCALVILAVVISINIYLKFKSVDEIKDVMIISFSSTIKPKITSHLHIQGNYPYAYK